MHLLAVPRLYVLSAVLPMLVAIAIVPTLVGASTIVSGCAGAASATESNGFFTLSGSSASGANGCYAMSYDDGNASPGNTCADACALAGLACPSSVVLSTTADCTAALDWYMASSAKNSGIPASPAAGSHSYCGFQSFFGGAWERADKPMPSQDNVACDARRYSGPALYVQACKCGVTDSTPPAVSNVVASQASPSSVTVTGSVDEASTVYCTIGASGDTHTPASVKSAGFTDTVASAGSFSVTVTGVSGDGTKSVACVGEDAANNLGSTVSSGADFHFDATGPIVSSVGGTHSGSTAQITGTTDEAGTVYCVVDTTGATVAPSSVKSTGQSTTVASAGSFNVAVTVADVTGKSAFCAGEDGVGNLGATATGPFGTAPSDISLSAATVAENSAQGTEIGTLSTTDEDAGDTFTYSITAQDIAAALQISGDKLQVGTGALDFEATPTMSVTVRSTDSSGLTFDKTFTVTLTDVNEAPSSVVFSATSVESQAKTGELVGVLSTIDVDTDDSFTYTIATAPAGVFYVDNNNVRVGAAFDDLSSGQVVNMNVTTTDAGGLSVTRSVSTAIIRSKSNLLVLITVTGVLGVAALATAAYFVKCKRTTTGGAPIAV